jgi:hypothetical protein
VAEEPREPERARGLLAFLTTTDHKRIGIAYMVTAYAFFLVGGALAMLIRTELAEPGSGLLSQGSTTRSSRCTAASCCSCSWAPSRSAWATTSCRCR